MAIVAEAGVKRSAVHGSGLGHCAVGERLSDGWPHGALCAAPADAVGVFGRGDFYQTEWPRRTRAYEYGVYTDQMLQNFFMPGMMVLTNLSAA